GLALQHQQALGVDQEARACHGWAKLLVAPVQQQHAQHLLQRGDAAGHGRRREEQLLGRARHALERAHPVESLDKAQIRAFLRGNTDGPGPGFASMLPVSVIRSNSGETMRFKLALASPALALTATAQAQTTWDLP